jgi:hypothetical protein
MSVKLCFQKNVCSCGSGAVQCTTDESQIAWGPGRLYVGSGRFVIATDRQLGVKFGGQGASELHPLHLSLRTPSIPPREAVLGALGAAM